MFKTFVSLLSGHASYLIIVCEFETQELYSILKMEVVPSSKRLLA